MSQQITFPNEYTYSEYTNPDHPMWVDISEAPQIIAHQKKWHEEKAKDLRLYIRRSVIGNIFVYVKDFVCVEVIASIGKHSTNDAWRKKWVGKHITNIRRDCYLYFKGDHFQSGDYINLSEKRHSKDVQRRVCSDMLDKALDDMRLHRTAKINIEEYKTKIETITQEIDALSEQMKNLYEADFPPVTEV